MLIIKYYMFNQCINRIPLVIYIILFILNITGCNVHSPKVVSFHQYQRSLWY